MRRATTPLAVALAALVAAGSTLLPAAAIAAPPRPPVPKPAPALSPEQREADRHFQTGVALYRDGKYAEALAEFERAYQIAPHPLVLYNIAGCHRLLSHYAEAVAAYRRFLDDGAGVVTAERLATARAELDATLALVARVTVSLAPPAAGATLAVDGIALDHPAMPLILPPGEHRLTARVAGRPDAERTVRVASGDALSVELAIPDSQPAASTAPGATRPAVTAERAPSGDAPRPRRFAIGAGFGTNLRLARNTGAPSISAALAITSRLELGLDAVLIAYAVIPSVRVRLIGDALALHAIAAVPYAITDGGASDRFAAAAIGLGLRYRPLPGVAVRLESYAAIADRMHGTSVPAFLGGELWF
jgi:hypothetical protein